MMMRGMMNRMGMAPDRNAGERRTAIPAGESVLVRLITRQGQAVSTTLEKALPAGLSTLEIDGEPHRVCLVFLPNGRYTALAEPMAMREATVLEQAKTAVMPLLVLLPLLLFAISAVLWRALRPLKRALPGAVLGRDQIGNDLAGDCRLLGIPKIGHDLHFGCRHPIQGVLLFHIHSPITERLRSSRCTGLRLCCRTSSPHPCW